MNKTIVLSFKNKPEDAELFEWIEIHSGKSAFIKDILRDVMILERVKKSEKVETSIIWGV
jgi:hypothetical protein